MKPEEKLTELAIDCDFRGVSINDLAIEFSNCPDAHVTDGNLYYNGCYRDDDDVWEFIDWLEL